MATSGQSLRVVAPPVKDGGALGIAVGSLDVQLEIRHEPLYASIGRPRAKTPNIANIGAISLFYLSLLILC